MRFVLSLLSILSLTYIAVAGGGQQTDRTAAIWSAAQDRLEHQNDVWFMAGDFPRVIQNLRFQAALSPKDYEIVTNLGWMLENVLDRASALALYIRYREANPGDPEAYYPEGEFYFHRKAYDKVIAVIEPSLKVGRGPLPNSYRILAHAYEKLNLLSDAERVWKAYLQREPKDLPAKANLSRIEKKLHGV